MRRWTSFIPPLCLGDVMLDDFVYGEVTRVSPEAPTPVLAVRHSVVEIGGAGNFARNVAALDQCPASAVG